MDRSVPAGAAPLLAFIRRTETGKPDPLSYTTIIGHNEDRLDRAITSMTVDEIIAQQPSWLKRFKVASGAAGAYQIIRPTLSSLKASQKLAGTERFTAPLQDALGLALLKGRGLDRFLAGQLTVTAFGNALAKEWASFPLLSSATRKGISLKRGQSYYDGFAGNSALTTPAKVEAVLAACLTAAGATVERNEPPVARQDPPAGEPLVTGAAPPLNLWKLGTIAFALLAVIGFIL